MNDPYINTSTVDFDDAHRMFTTFEYLGIARGTKQCRFNVELRRGEGGESMEAEVYLPEVQKIIDRAHRRNRSYVIFRLNPDNPLQWKSRFPLAKLQHRVNGALHQLSLHRELAKIPLSQKGAARTRVLGHRVAKPSARAAGR